MKRIVFGIGFILIVVFYYKSLKIENRNYLKEDDTKTYDSLNRPYDKQKKITEFSINQNKRRKVEQADVEHNKSDILDQDKLKSIQEVNEIKNDDISNTPDNGIAVSTGDLEVLNPTPTQQYSRNGLTSENQTSLNGRSMLLGYNLDITNNPQFEKLIGISFISKDKESFKFILSQNGEGLDFEHMKWLIIDGERKSSSVKTETNYGSLTITSTDTLMYADSENHFKKIQFLNNKMTKIKIVEFKDDEEITSNIYLRTTTYD